MIQKTKDYDQFEFMLGNREVSDSLVRKLEASILKNNLLAYNPILVNEKNEIIDGQHRLIAAQNIDVEIYYRVVDGHASIAEVMLLNANQRGWKLMDYIDSYANMGNENYTVLKGFLDKYHLPTKTSARMLMDEVGGDAMTQHLQNGSFEIRSLRTAIRIAEYVEQLAPLCDGNIYKTDRFITAIYKVWILGHLDELVRKAQTWTRIRGEKIMSRGEASDYLREFEDIINWNRKDGKTIRLY